MALEPELEHDLDSNVSYYLQGSALLFWATL